MRPAYLQRTYFYFAVSIDDIDGSITTRITNQSALRDEDGGLINAFSQNGTNIHAGQQILSGIWENGPQSYGSSCFIHTHIRKLKRSGFTVFRTILKQKAYTGMAAVSTLELAAFKAALQPQHFRTRLCHIHIHGIKLLHCGKSLRLIFRHQRSWCYL